jgi:hypothetical protein
MKTPQEIYKKYHDRYDGEIQGCCLLIADEIQKAVGGEVVAGFLTFSGHKRSHWWVEKEGQTIDPMGDHILSFEDYPGREEEHRDFELFEELLPNYEQWRVL